MNDAEMTDQFISISVKIRTSPRSPFEASTVRAASPCSLRGNYSSQNAKLFKSNEISKDLRSSRKYINSSRDPYKKTHRHDYQIFSAVKSYSKIVKLKNIVNETSQRNFKIGKQKNIMKRPESRSPARFLSTKKIREQIKVRYCELAMPGLESDLRLIKDINTVDLLKSFEMEKLYGSYLTHFQDSSLKENSFDFQVNKSNN